MAITLSQLSENHIEDAAKLVGLRYQALCRKERHLPPRYAHVDILAPLLENILKAGGQGVAAYRGGRLVGFLTAWNMNSFRGLKSTYSPEWAHAAVKGDRQRIYQAMYGYISALWVADRYIAHYISLFPHDSNLINTWHWLGFGMISVDGIRGLDPLPDSNWRGSIYRAGIQDIEAVLALSEGLSQYMRQSPIFLLSHQRDRSYYQEWLQNPEKVVWLADHLGEPVAFLQAGPADTDVCTIIQDMQTTSIYAAFTQEAARGTGISSALLAQAVDFAKESGYSRCAVSFEPMNTAATRFWFKHFSPACYSLFRHIDERITVI